MRSRIFQGPYALADDEAQGDASGERAERTCERRRPIMASEDHEDESDHEAELHGDGDVEEVLRAEQETDEARQDARQNVALEAEDGADRDGQRGGELKFQPWG